MSVVHTTMVVPSADSEALYRLPLHPLISDVASDASPLAYKCRSALYWPVIWIYFRWVYRKEQQKVPKFRDEKKRMGVVVRGAKHV